MSQGPGSKARDLALPDRVGLALRDHRRRLGAGQRSYALRRGWSAGHVARLETAAGNLRLADVLTALEGTGFRLDLRRDTAQETDLEGGTDAADGVPSGSPWPVTDLVARDRRGRRFPPYRDVRHTPEGPRWWWLTASMPTTSRPPMWSAEGPSEAQMESWVAEYRALQERRRRDAET